MFVIEKASGSQNVPEAFWLCKILLSIDIGEEICMILWFR